MLFSPPNPPLSDSNSDSNGDGAFSGSCSSLNNLDPATLQSSIISSTFSAPQFAAHTNALRVEVVQRQLRNLLQKLMNHSLNKNIFNVPVDAVELKLPDYDK